MRKVNLFIVGAPKCGTTSLYAYLENHQGVCAPDFKEMRFFCDDLNIDRIDSLDAYHAAFSSAEMSAQYLLDASPVYLSSGVAVKNIHDYNPAAKLIVMLRHPADLFFSMHGQAVYGFTEEIDGPEKAWRMQAERADGVALPRGCKDPFNLQYKDRCALGSQLERMFSIFSREQMLVVSLDELKKDPKALYEKVLAFLGLESDGRTDFPKENSSQRHRIQWVGRILMMKRKNFLKLTSDSLKTGSVTKQIILQVCRKTGSTLREWNTIPYKRPSPRPEFVQELVEFFQPEVDKVKKLTGLELKSSLLK
jgi:hypothetical protein